eukprot:Gregarina_sp_Poly_1__5270@NODE_2791_length_1714_cov_63_695203_g1757_i0_p2_GENE_NODE_2791_length_1714_cov_63_695203_g1757_i0NODE_2791_length_1714_cov_63_695203_g1757_i0_p2_ORF_typecomplete_len138_score7_97Cytomega_US3/PF05963_11/0_6_NODE_2791_length_1714_cov_63_695203_g1757_i011311544
MERPAPHQTAPKRNLHEHTASKSPFKLNSSNVRLCFIPWSGNAFIATPPSSFSASTFFWFLCKTVMVPLWWCAAMLIRTAVFAVIVPAILFAMFGVNVLKLMIRLNWIRLLSGEFLEDLLHQADLPPRHAKEPTNKT